MEQWNPYHWMLFHWSIVETLGSEVAIDRPDSLRCFATRKIAMSTKPSHEPRSNFHASTEYCGDMCVFLQVWACSPVHSYTHFSDLKNRSRPEKYISWMWYQQKAIEELVSKRFWCFLDESKARFLAPLINETRAELGWRRRYQIQLDSFCPNLADWALWS